MTKRLIFRDELYLSRKKYIINTFCSLKLFSHFRGTIFKALKVLYVTHACTEYLENLPLLEENCGYRCVGWQEKRLWVNNVM